MYGCKTFCVLDEVPYSFFFQTYLILFWSNDNWAAVTTNHTSRGFQSLSFQCLLHNLRTLWLLLLLWWVSYGNLMVMCGNEGDTANGQESKFTFEHIISIHLSCLVRWSAETWFLILIVKIVPYSSAKIVKWEDVQNNGWRFRRWKQRCRKSAGEDVGINKDRRWR